MLDFRKHRRSPVGLPVPRFLLMLLGLGVFLFIVTWWTQPVGDLPVASGPIQDRTAARLGEEAPAGNSKPEAGQAEKVTGGDAYFPGVHPQYLDAVRDDTVFRAPESDAWFHLLELLEKNTEERLAAASLGPVGYLQLERQPQAYRGRLVTVSGTARSATEVTAPANSYGIERYYQIWLQPLRSDPELIVVYALYLPLDFPVGEELDEPITTSGFFFKRWAYPSRSGILTAPLVLARSITWTPAEPTVVTGSSEERALVAAAAAAVFAFCFVFWVWRRSRRPRSTSSQPKVQLDSQTLAEAADQNFPT